MAASCPFALDFNASHVHGLASAAETPLYEVGRGPLLLPPLPSAELFLPPAWLPAFKREAVPPMPRHAHQQWQRAAASARQSGVLRIAVLGVSSSAGCGSGEAWELPIALCDKGGCPATREVVKDCRLERSWTRRLVDELSSLICKGGGSHQPCTVALAVNASTPSVSLSHKNAVIASFFASCTQSHLPALGADVVLLEVATSIGGSDPAALVRAVRAAAPDAAVAFVKWLMQSRNQTAPRRGCGKRRASGGAIRRGCLAPEVITAAESEGADIVPVHNVIQSMLSPKAVLDNRYIYAQRGHDQVHPSAVGHAIIAAVTARWLTARLLEGGCSSGGPTRHRYGKEQLAPWGTCWNRADELPLLPPSPSSPQILTSLSKKKKKMQRPPRPPPPPSSGCGSTWSNETVRCYLLRHRDLRLAFCGWRAMRLCHHDRARCHYVKHGQTENRSFECSPLPAPRNLNSSTIATASTITSSPSTIATTFTSPSFAAIAAPATSTPGWSLVDEGQAKGVLKLGLASSVLGSVLRIGPLPGPPGAACAPLTARLGYLVSSTRQHMGAFHVACEGCLCFSSMHYYQDMYPFPEVQADALYSPDPTYMRHNVTLTASTEFTILWNATSECSLRITNTLADPFFVVKRKHRNVGARPITKPTDPSNVRIDSLQLSPLSRADVSTTAFWTTTRLPSHRSLTPLHSMLDHERHLLGSRHAFADALLTVHCTLAMRADRSHAHLLARIHQERQAQPQRQRV